MDESSRVYDADPELANLLGAAADSNEPLRVRSDSDTYIVQVRREQQDLFANYEPEQVRATLRKYAGSWSDLDTEAMKETLREAREIGSRNSNRA